MENRVRIKRNIYIIISVVLLLGIALELTRSEFILQWSKKQNEFIQANVVSKQNGISQEELIKIKQEKFLIVYDPEVEDSVHLKDNIQQVLTYMKKDYEVADVYRFTRVDSTYTTVILTFEQLKKVPDLDAIVEYVSQGGYVFFGIRPDVDDAFYRIYRKLGINDMRDAVEIHGLKLKSNLLLQSKDMEINEEFIFNSSTVVELDTARCNIYAVTSNDIPLLWDVPLNKGKFMMFNGTVLRERINRGLLAGAISLLQPDFIYPVMNMKIMFIDDFPAPFPAGVNEQLFQYYQKDISSFYRDIWWPEMVQAAARYDLKYTSVIIETYNDRVAPPFEDRQGTEKNNLITYGRDLLKSGGELGYHGYNHQSLVTDQAIVDELEYNAWPDIPNMVGSLRELSTFMKGVFPDYEIRSYVPPSNILSEEGRRAIAEALPDVKIISAVYHEDVSGKALVQEFMKRDDGFIELPRLTSGYENSQNNRYSIANGLTSIGVFSHFIHPDDILDSERSSGKAWPDLSQEYAKMLGDVHNHYPWLRSMTASEAGEELEKYLSTKVYLEKKGNRILGYMNDFTSDMYFILRTSKKIAETTNCKITSIDEGVYLIRADNPKFEIELEG